MPPSSLAYVIFSLLWLVLWTKAIIVLQLKHQVINSFFASRTLNLMPRFKWETSVFARQLQRRARIAVGILCSSWHMGHPPKAMKYITCRVMPFRPWHALCGPLVRLSCHHSGISLLPSIPSMSPSLLLLICSTRLPQFQPFGFGLYCPLFSSLPSPSLCNCLYSSPSLSPCMVVICNQHARECRGTLRCHDPETPH